MFTSGMPQSIPFREAGLNDMMSSMFFSGFSVTRFGSSTPLGHGRWIDSQQQVHLKIYRICMMQKIIDQYLKRLIGSHAMKNWGCFESQGRSYLDFNKVLCECRSITIQDPVYGVHVTIKTKCSEVNPSLNYWLKIWKLINAFWLSRV